MKKLTIALIGLGFGGSFAEIYKAHPNVEKLIVFDTNKALEKKFREKLNIAEKYSTFKDILDDPSIDAVHLVTPIPLHEQQSADVLYAGKHCACTVPMATSHEGIRRIISAQKASGKNYMLMETTLFTYQFFYVQNLIRTGELGNIQFMRGSHYQDMSGWPDYWKGLPPMYYGTHAISPLRVLAGAPFKKVVCFGSGKMSPDLYTQYKNPFPVESALFEFENGIKAEATRTLFETARTYQEGMFIYGSHKSFEWGFEDNSDPYITELLEIANGRGRNVSVQQLSMPNYCADLPDALKQFTVGNGFDPLNPQLSLTKGAGAGHHGSHPHLVNEFINSIIMDTTPAVDITLATNITSACLCAHESALNNGRETFIPDYK